MIKIIINIFFSNLKRHVILLKYIYRNPTCVFYNYSQISNTLFGKYVTIFENNKIFNAKIDSYTYVQFNSRVFNCEIGKFCSLANSVSIAPGIHDLNNVTTHPSLIQKSTPLPKVFAKKDNIVSCKKVIIGNDVWIGENSLIMDGVKVGNGAVIAAGAIVVKDVEPYSVVAGVPAKHIKYRFDIETITILQKSEWWDFPEEWFEKNSELMLNPTDFITYLKNDKQSF